MAFHYPCYKRLMSNLGRIDAICGYATLAVGLLSEELQQNNSPREWLSGTARMHGLILHDVDDELLPHRLAQMFIVTVHAQFEEFLISFLEEHRESASWPEKKREEALSHYVLTNLGMIFKKDCANDREMIEYYRLLRNRFSHVEVNSKRVENQRIKVRGMINATKDFEPPKAYESVDYGDFDLFTRAVKSLAERICIEAKPTDEVLAEMAKTGPFAALQRYRKNLSRYRNALKQKLLMEFGLDATESSNIVEPVLKGR